MNRLNHSRYHPISPVSPIPPYMSSVYNKPSNLKNRVKSTVDLKFPSKLNPNPFQNNLSNDKLTNALVPENISNDLSDPTPVSTPTPQDQDSNDLSDPTLNNDNDSLSLDVNKEIPTIQLEIPKQLFSTSDIDFHQTSPQNNLNDSAVFSLNDHMTPIQELSLEETLNIPRNQMNIDGRLPMNKKQPSNQLRKFNQEFQKNPFASFMLPSLF